MTNKPFTRITALLLACSMTLTLLSPAALAEEVTAFPETPTSMTETAEEIIPVEDETADNSDSDVSESAEEVIEDAAPKTADKKNTPIQPLSGKKAVRKISRSAADTEKFLQRHTLNKPVRSIRVDTKKNKVTVDGKTVSVAAVFGEEAEDAGILDSTAAAKSYLKETPFEVQSVQSGTLTVTAPFQTRRLLVRTDDLKADFGASEILEDTRYDEYYLQFDTEEETQTAYDTLCDVYGEEDVTVDEVLWADEVLTAVSAPEIHEGISYPNDTISSWGNGCMGTGLLKLKPIPNAPTVTVAIIDTGIDPNNWFFAGRTISNKSWNMTADPEKKALGKGSMVDNSANGHGTHVASIVTDGTPANVELLIIRLFDDSGKTNTSQLQVAMDYAISCGADVINLSLGQLFSTDFLKTRLEAAHEKNIPVVCAAGNSYGGAVLYPAKSPLTVAVSSVDSRHQLSTFSSVGSEVDFCAPGTSIHGAQNKGTRGSYRLDSGTSMASPHITAALACVKLHDRSKTVDACLEALKATCLDLGTKGKDKQFGWGLPQLVTPPYQKDSQFFVDCRLCGDTIDNSCGNGVTWSLNNGLLTLSGSGKMTDYTESASAPWYPVRHLITSLSIGSGVTKLGSFAFQDCINLKNPTIPASVTEIGVGAFSGCTSITAFQVAEGNPSYKTSPLNVLLSKDGATLHTFPAGYSVNGNPFLFNLPGSVTDVQPYAFSGTSNLYEIVFPVGLRSIRTRAFENCPQLRRIYFRCDYPTIAEDAFVGVKPSVASYSAETAHWPQSVPGFGALNSNKQPFTDWRPYHPNLADCTVSDCPDVLYSGSPITPALTVTSNENTLTANDYTVSYANNVEVGTATVTITGKYAYYGTKTLTFNIRKDITQAKVSAISAQTYSGKALTPAVTLTADGKKLTADTDYTVSYKNNVKVGSATVTINGKGNWSGTVQKTFTIQPKPTTVSSVSNAKSKTLTVKWKKISSVKGYQVQIATNKTFTAGVKKKTVSKNATVSATFSSLKKKTVYYTRIRTYQTVNGKNVYSPWKVYGKSSKVK